MLDRKTISENKMRKKSGGISQDVTCRLYETVRVRKLPIYINSISVLQSLSI